LVLAQNRVEGMVQGFAESLHQVESVKCQALHVYLCTLYVYLYV